MFLQGKLLHQSNIYLNMCSKNYSWSAKMLFSFTRLKEDYKSKLIKLEKKPVSAGECSSRWKYVSFDFFSSCHPAGLEGC